MGERTCAIDGCERKHCARGWCDKHYRRWHAGQDPSVRSRNELPVIERFWSKVHKEPSGCWLWTDALNSSGYGSFTVNGKRMLVHRWVYEHFIGPIPEGYEIDHVQAFGCTHRHCVNYLDGHLEPVTHIENQRRGDGAAHQRARQTHCIHGHEFTPENTIRRPMGRRGCKECRRGAEKRYDERKRQERKRKVTV